VREISKELDVV